ncbi:MAG: hypothetical protein NTW21_27875 [Verrucomicrobia bacterium]|nr:hypothetical protein [Verrucomicrobiota bacterium]
MRSLLTVMALGIGIAGSGVARAADEDNTRTFKADKRYLVLPCARGVHGQNKVSIDMDGKPYLAVANTLITATEPDHWRFIDLKLMQGKMLSVKIEGPGAAAMDLVKVSDTIPGQYPLYQEPGRPKVHFSPPRGSLNDPCGMIYFEGQWHLYYAAKRFFNNDCGNPNSMWAHATSTDLLHWEEQPLFLAAVEGQYSFWTETGVLEDQIECPNLFQLPVDGNEDNMRWVILGSQNAYQTGKFDGKVFVPDDKSNTKIRSQFGQFSSSQVFANAPGGRIVQVGWAHCCWEDTEFTQMAAFPLELCLRTTPEGVRMYQDFIPELGKLRKPGSTQKDVVVKADSPVTAGDISQPAEILVEFEPGNASQVTFTGAQLDINWNAQSQELKVKEFTPWEYPAGNWWTTGYWPDKTVLKASPIKGRITLHILLDVASTEVVTNGGENYVVQGRDYQKLGEKSPMEIRNEGGDVKITRLEIYPLKSIH